MNRKEATSPVNRRAFYITTTSGMSGYFAVMIVTEDGCSDVWQTGVGRYKTRAEAEREGRDWARDEELEFK